MFPNFLFRANIDQKSIRIGIILFNSFQRIEISLAVPNDYAALESKVKIIICLNLFIIYKSNQEQQRLLIDAFTLTVCNLCNSMYW